MVMLFLVFLQIPLKDILKSFKNLKFTLTAVIINFIWTPLLILVLGRLFLVDHPELLIGYIMLMVTPCTDWYLIFTGISKGNVALGSSILPLNLVLQLVLLPVYVFLIGVAYAVLQHALDDGRGARCAARMQQHLVFTVGCLDFQHYTFSLIFTFTSKPVSPTMTSEKTRDLSSPGTPLPNASG